jgi:hypothetical protein
MIKSVIVSFFAGFLTVYSLAAFTFAATGLSTKVSAAAAMFQAALHRPADFSHCSGTSGSFFICNGGKLN